MKGWVRLSWVVWCVCDSVLTVRQKHFILVCVRETNQTKWVSWSSIWITSHADPNRGKFVDCSHTITTLLPLIWKLSLLLLLLPLSSNLLNLWRQCNPPTQRWHYHNDSCATHRSGISPSSTPPLPFVTKNSSVTRLALPFHRGHMWHPCAQT